MAEKKPPEALTNITGWLEDENGFTIDDAGDVTIAGDPPLDIQLTIDDQRVTITHVTTEAGAGAGRVDAIISAFPDRGTTLHAAAAVDRSGVTITVTNHVYVDGLSRQSFMTALNDLVASIDTIGAVPSVVATATEPAAETRVQDPVTTDVVEVVESAVTSEVAVESVGGWVPTHRVPAAGMRAWAEPDPSQQPVTRLEAGVELVIAEQRGDWARVVGSNSWTGWVDARRIQEIGAASAVGGGSSINLGGLELRPLPLVGAAALLLSAFLPWVSGFASVNSLDVALSFLWDLNAAGAPYLGWVIIGLAAVTLALSAAKTPNPQLMQLVGVLAVATTGAFLVQMYRGITDSGGAFGDVFDFLGIAPWVSLGAGVVIIAGANKLRATAR